jgi:hypothetical protein
MTRDENGSEPMRREAYERQRMDHWKRLAYAAAMGLVAGGVIGFIL